MLLPKPRPRDAGAITGKALPFATHAAACLLISALSAQAANKNTIYWDPTGPMIMYYQGKLIISSLNPPVNVQLRLSRREMVTLGRRFILAAGPADKWRHDPATQEWFKSLQNGYGTSCCDYADGSRVEDPDWRQNDDGSYSVVWKGQWIKLDPKRVLQGTNRVGYAILWGNPSVDQPYCFLPGARG